MRCLPPSSTRFSPFPGAPDRLIDVLFDAIKHSSDHSALPDLVVRHRGALSCKRIEGHKNRNAIEGKAEEFSNEKGIPVSDQSPAR
jgi:hypothetical protein